MDRACLLGCGVATGWGSAVNSAEVQVGDTVIVMGIGGIGINAVQGASHAGAANVIAVVTGIGDMTQVGLPVSLAELTLFQKRIQGSLFGSCSPSVDIPRQVALYQAGKLKLDALVTTTYALDQLAQGYEDMHAARTSAGSSSTTDCGGPRPISAAREAGPGA